MTHYPKFFLNKGRILALWVYNLKTVYGSNYWHFGGNSLHLLTKYALMKRWQKIWAGPSPSFGQNPKEQQFFRETIPLKIEQRECSALRNMIKMMMTVISMIEAPSLGWNCLSVMESVPSPRLELALPSFQLISSPLLVTSLVSLTN